MKHLIKDGDNYKKLSEALEGSEINIHLYPIDKLAKQYNSSKKEVQNKELYRKTNYAFEVRRMNKINNINSIQ